ncbi:MAG TPA: hypothetical protein VLY04_04005 [Bryobacteraceae bacterium]|nr:hypothetical protein [Bryobacteraceae bacterium]
MSDLRRFANIPLKWSQPKGSRRFHQLAADQAVIGSIQFEKGWGSLATGECGEGRWTFKRAGFFSPRVTVRQAGSENDIAIFAPRWSGAGTLEFASGGRFQLRCQNFWGTEWAFENEQGMAAVNLRGPRGFVKQGGESVITKVGAELPEAPVLLLLLWYVRLLMNEDASAAAVIATSG